MIDFTREETFPLSYAAEILPRRRAGKKTNQATLHRWATIGVRGRVLETIKMGGLRCTSREALQRFFDKLTAPEAKTPVPTTRERKRRIAAAERVLDKAGV